MAYLLKISKELDHFDGVLRACGIDLQLGMLRIGIQDFLATTIFPSCGKPERSDSVPCDSVSPTLLVKIVCRLADSTIEVDLSRSLLR